MDEADDGVVLAAGGFGGGGDGGLGGGDFLGGGGGEGGGAGTVRVKYEAGTGASAAVPVAEDRMKPWLPVFCGGQHSQP